MSDWPVIIFGGGFLVVMIFAGCIWVWDTLRSKG